MNNSKRFKVGVRLPDWVSGYASRLFEGFLDFQRTGSAMELHFDQPSGGDIPPAPIDEHWKGDGLLVYRHTTEEAKAWKKAGIAVVNLSTEIPSAPPDFPRVTVDNHALGKMAYKHLAALGLNDFAYIHESTRLYSMIRLQSFRECVLVNGGNFHQIDVPAANFPPESRPEIIEQCMVDSVAALPRPCGLFVKDDIAGLWTSRLLQKLGIRCPDEMPLLGVSDDIIFCHTSQPALSSIPYPGRKIGFAAASLLDSIMRGQHIASNHWLLLPPEPIIARESTHQVILKDDVVNRALSFLRGEIHHRPVSVSELSSEVGVSREGLRQRFVAALGHSPKKEIDRLRCHSITEVLRNSEDTLETIAESHGFEGADELCRMIKRVTDKTPGEIRSESRR